MSREEPVTIKKKIAKNLSAPVEKGMAAGQIDYYVGDDMVASFPVKTTKKVEKWDMDFCAKTLLNRFLFCYNAD